MTKITQMLGFFRILQSLMARIDGYKVYIASTAMFLNGLVELINSFNGQGGDLNNAITQMSGAFGLGGLKHSNVKVSRQFHLNPNINDNH